MIAVNFSLPLLLLLTAASSQSPVFVRDDLITRPTPERFSVCHNGTCDQVSTVSLKKTQWNSIRSLFAASAKTPTMERQLIARSIALFEQVVGQYTGTFKDKGGNLKGIFQSGQMDCIDESTNTTFYLMMLKNAGLLKWHSVEQPSTRYYSIFTIPHTSAVIKENISGHRYAVDSWFRANGKDADIIPIKKWRRGWTPNKTQ